jgi:hypothetical protein
MPVTCDGDQGTLSILSCPGDRPCPTHPHGPLLTGWLGASTPKLAPRGFWEVWFYVERIGSNEVMTR